MAFRTRIEMRVMRGKREKNAENRERESRRSRELRRDLLVAWDAIFINSARERERERERDGNGKRRAHRLIPSTRPSAEKELESQNPICLGEIRFGEIEENAISRSRFAPPQDLFHSVRNKTRLDTHRRKERRDHSRPKLYSQAKGSRLRGALQTVSRDIV